MANTLTLYTCHIDDGGLKIHPCRRAHEALRDASRSYENEVFDHNRFNGWFTKGKRPKLKEMTGQEKLPVLGLPDGTYVCGSGNIVSWARENAPATAA